MRSNKKNLFRSLFSKHGSVAIPGNVPTLLGGIKNLKNSSRKFYGDIDKEADTLVDGIWLPTGYDFRNRSGAPIPNQSGAPIPNRSGAPIPNRSGAPIPKPTKLSWNALKKTFGEMVSSIRSQPVGIKALLALSAVGAPILAYKGFKHFTKKPEVNEDIGSPILADKGFKHFTITKKPKVNESIGSRIGSWWSNLTPQQKLLTAVGALGIPSAAFLGARALSGNKKKKNRNRWSEE